MPPLAHAYGRPWEILYFTDVVIGIDKECRGAPCLEVGSSCFHICYITGEYGSGSYKMVIGLSQGHRYKKG